MPVTPGTALTVLSAEEVDAFNTTFVSGSRVWGQITYKDPSAKRIWLGMPDWAETVEITHLKAGSTYNSYTLTADEYLNKVGEAQKKNKDEFDSFTLEEKPSGIPSPEITNTEVINATAVRISWTSKNPTVLIRTLDRAPQTLLYGNILARRDAGDNKTILEAYTDILNEYTVFALKDWKLSKGASVTLLTDEVMKKQESNSSR